MAHLNAHTVLEEIRRQADAIRERGDVPERVELGPGPYRALQEHFGPVGEVLGLAVQPGGRRGRVHVQPAPDD